MSKGTIKRIFLSALLLLSVLPSRAQNEAYNSYSPYTMFGIGDINKQGAAWNKSMGGVGIASRDKKVINYLNPAAVTAREEKSFLADFGLEEGNRIYRQGDYTSANNTFNIHNFVISFPVYKSLAVYSGFTPYCDLGYSVSNEVTDPNVIGNVGNVTSYSKGFGGMSDVFIGAGIQVVKGLSAGVEYQHLFGNLEKKHAMEFGNSSFRSIYSGYSMNLKADAVKFGLQYEFPVGKTLTAVAGATYKLSANLKGTVQDYEYNNISSVIDTSRNVITDLRKNKGLVKLASEAAVGVALRGGEKWTAEVNYIYSDWSNTGMDKVPGFANVGNAVFSASRSQSVRAGFSIVPNRNDIRYYRKRITYRGGAYWDQAYCQLDGNNIDAFGLTFGVTLPVIWNNGVSLGVDLGQRGLHTGSMIRERYVNFNIGINVFDIWFLKHKYD
ncbi:MAG: hypothetical protein MJY86_06585 [Bacteroidales bacterium]|nr:hypothetical protein [Candidatus Cryptobacteroides faecihippi]MCQ2162927.1 hypothetical protein [Bacteroidales bacterium]